VKEEVRSPIILKIGGSLIQPERTEALQRLCRQITELAKDFKLFILTGGGSSADIVREFDAQLGLTATAAHFAAISAMEQNSYILADLFTEVERITELDQCTVDKQQINLFYPLQYLHTIDPLSHSWEVTSDSIALYCAQELDSRLLVLLTDVDGAYQSKKAAEKDLDLFSVLVPDELTELEVVDNYFSTLYSRDDNLDTWIINGLYPDRLRELLTTDQTRGTKIKV
jgi:hypothetical protein